MADGKFASKRVYITGAGAGIGLELCKAFADGGADIVASDINEEGLSNVKREVEQKGRRCRTYIIDVANEDRVEAVATELEADDQLPDVIVNNAGIGYIGGFMETSAADWRRTYDINVLGVVHGCRAYIKRWREKGVSGHIVNVSSMSSVAPMPNLSAYVASKYAVEGFCDVLSMELVGDPIDVTCVHPGVINTDIVKNNAMLRIPTEQIQRLQNYYGTKGARADIIAEQIVNGVAAKKGNIFVGPGGGFATMMKRLLPRKTFRSLLTSNARQIGYL